MAFSRMATILTVDDSASIRRMLTMTLKAAGHDVEQACDGVDGINKAKQKKYDALLVDVNMPKMDGITMIRQLRGIINYAHTPMLILTTEASLERKLEGREAGATGSMVKPFDPETLVQTLKRVIP